MIYQRSEVKKSMAPSWSIMGLVKKIMGVVMLFAIMKMILFPSQSDSAVDTIQSQIDKIPKMTPSDFESLALNQTELNQITLAGGLKEQ